MPIDITPLQEYRSVIDRETRAEIAQDFEDLDPTDYDAVAKAAQKLMVHLLRGHVPTGVVKEARELLQTQLVAMAARDRTKEGGTGPAGFLMTIVKDSRQPRQLEAKYTVDVESEEVETVEVKAAS